MNELIAKYNVPGPRYTSYPTVPHWDNQHFGEDVWRENITKSFHAKGKEQGISLYIHLPYCESLCTYCGCNTRITTNHRVEEGYIQTLLREWEIYLSLFGSAPKIKEIHFGGGTPTFFSAENLALLIQGLFKKSTLAENAELGFEGHPNSTTENHLRTLHRLGFRRVSFGIQDFDPKVQEIINRKQSFEQVEKVTNLARQIGYVSINFDLVYGLPLQNLQSVGDTINKIKWLKPDRIAFYSYAHVPWIKPGQRKFTELDLPDNETKRVLYELGRDMLQEAGYREIGMDHFALPTDELYIALENKTLHRNFMGYTTCHTAMLVGLGCSSISDAGSAFAQNAKKVEDYMTSIRKGILPICNGHELNKNDKIVRNHILNLMCKYETSWKQESEKWSGIFDTLIKLADMEQDGIVELAKDTVKITAEGKAFVRNVCMAFDQYLLMKESSSPLFSKVI